jgi:hypothetical protein
MLYIRVRILLADLKLKIKSQKVKLLQYKSYRDLLIINIK